MARTMAVYLAVAIFGFNMSLALLNAFDSQIWMPAMGRSLFGSTITPDTSYNNLPDAVNNGTIDWNNSASVANATERMASYGPQTGFLDQFGFWSLTKNSLSTIINFLYRGFFGLPWLLYKFGLDMIFVLPMHIVVGLIQIIGGYEIIRGSSL